MVVQKQILINFITTKDIFALHAERMVNAYHEISLRNLELTVPKVPLRERVYLGIIPDKKSRFTEVRF